jgi:hypothetical protein
VTGEQDARRPLDPVVAGLLDGANAGYQALESVLHGLNEGLRRQAARPGHPPPSPTSAPRTGFAPHTDPATDRSGRALTPADRAARSGALLDQMLGIVDGLLGVATNVTRNLADLNTTRRFAATPAQADASAPLQVVVRASPGTDASGDFVLWNTGASIQADVSFKATDLMGGRSRIPGRAVSFSPRSVAQISPGASEQIKVVVSVPPDAAPGHYHGIVQPSVGAAWAVVDLEVLAASPA